MIRLFFALCSLQLSGCFGAVCDSNRHHYKTSRTVLFTSHSTLLLSQIFISTGADYFAILIIMAYFTFHTILYPYNDVGNNRRNSFLIYIVQV